MEGRGLTLMELLVVLAIGSILLTIAIPGYAFLVNASWLAVVVNDLVMALHQSRSASTMCKTNNPMAASPVCNATANWQEGWQLFVDGGCTERSTRATEARLRHLLVFHAQVGLNS